MNILTSAEGPYISAAETMLFSLLVNNPGRHNIYILSQEGPDSFNDIRLVCDRAGATLQVIDPRSISRNLRSLRTVPWKKIGVKTTAYRLKSDAMYHRIYAGQLLPSDVSRVLYLDCDLLVRKDLQSLWDTNLDEYYLAASSMNASIKRPDFAVKFGGRYFNSGVMLINLERWRREDVATRCEQIAMERPDDIVFHDQCLLNFACHPWREIGIEYNFSYVVGEKRANLFKLTVEQFRAIRENPAIIHFIGPEKPWLKAAEDLYDLEVEYPYYRKRYEQMLTETGQRAQL